MQDYQRIIEEHGTLLLEQAKKIIRQENALQEYKQQVSNLTSRQDIFEKAHASENGSLCQHPKTLGSNEKPALIRQNISSIDRAMRSGEGIAFSVQLTIFQDHVGIHQILKYDKVQLNDGGGYNQHTGIFTAPSSGVYMFAYFFSHNSQIGQAWIELMHNSKKINAAVSDVFHRYQDLQGGNFAFIQVAAGDTVWIESWHQSDAIFEGSYGFTTFSGALLY